MGVDENQIDITPLKDEGVLKQIIKEGHGDELPYTGDKVSVHYVGTLQEDGSKFDSSRDRGEQFEFTLGKGEVIKAWDIGVATMKKGEICKLICRSDYAYGAGGSPPKIPPNATLIFEVELFSWRGEDLSSKKDGGIMRRIVSQGEGYINPNDGATVEVAIVGRSNGKVFDDRGLRFTLGEGSEHDIPDGLEKALERFKKNEKSIIKLKSQYGFGEEGNQALGVGKNADLEYEVTLKDFTKAKETWELDPQEKLDQAKLCKERGTDFFKAEKFQKAIKLYEKVTDYLQYDSGLTDEQKKESKTILLAGHLNLSMCHLKLRHFIEAQDSALKAIEIDSSNVKAHFRRGQACLGTEDAELAKKAFERCVELDASNKAAQQQLQICNAKIKQHKLKEKQIYGGMFEKFAKVDAKKAAANNAGNDVMSGDLGEWGEGGKEPIDEEAEQREIDDKNLSNVQMI